jgi:microcystin-dependent protein
VATVKGKTSIKIDELIDSVVISGRVDEEGTLIFTTRGGAEILGGTVPQVLPLESTPLDAWPVGSVFLGTTPTNPVTLLGGGTWVGYARGRMLVGVDHNDPDFDAGGKTGGTKEHTLTEAQLPPHDHDSGELVMNSTGSHDHTINRRNTTGDGGGVAFGGGTVAEDTTTGNAGSHAHTISGSTADAGGGQPHNNMPPYVTVYMWRRTA